MDRAQQTLRDLLDRHDRVGITGAPKCGKTTLAMECSDRIVVHTDSTMESDWSEQPHEIIGMLDGVKRFLVEGVQVPRAMRKGLELDALLVLSKPYVEQTKRQQGMGKGVETVLKDWEQKNPKHGVELVRL